MPLTELDMAVLRAIATYYVLTREMVQQLCCASHSSGRGARKRLSRLRQAGYIVQHRVPVALPDTNGAAPVYYATRKGAEALASFYGDDEFLATNTKTPRADRLAHWIAINQTRLLIEAAVAELPMVRLLRWITEWETCNKSANKSDQFYLHTQLSENPPLSCSPDAGFLIEYQSERMVYYLEQDLATSSPRQIAARKSKGYYAASNLRVHRKQFPDTTLDQFRVLFLTTNDYRVRKTAEEMNSKPGKELWLMMNQRRISAGDFFSGPHALDSTGEYGPLITGLPNIVASNEAANRPHDACHSQSIAVRGQSKASQACGTS